MKKRSKGISISYLYFVINTIIGLFMSSFVVRTIGKTDYGVYQTMSAFIAYLALLEFGMGTIMSRNISLCKNDGSDVENLKRNVSTIWDLTLGLTGFIIAGAFVFYFFIDSIYKNSLSSEQLVLGKQLFAFAAGNLACSFLISTLDGVILGYECYSFSKELSIIRLIVRSIIVIVVLNIRVSVLYVAIIDFSMSLLSVAITFMFCVIKLKVSFSLFKFDKSIFKLITPLALAMLLQTIVNTANGSVDKFLISVMMTPEDVSVYSISMTMFTMFSSIATIPVSMYMPQIAQNMNKGMKERELTESLVSPCKSNVLITGLVSFGFLTIGRQFIILVYGNEYYDSWLYAIIVIFPMFVNMSNAVIINVIDVLRKRHIRSLILMITTTLNIVLTVIGIKTVGMIGAAAATGISLIGQIVTLNIYYKKKIKLDVVYLFYSSFKNTLPCFIISSVLGVLVKMVFKTTILQFVSGGAVFCIAFSTLFLMFNKSERRLIFEKFKQIIERKTLAT